MTIGALLYILLQVVFIGGVEPGARRQGLGLAARHGPLRLRRLVHPGPGRRRDLAGRRPDHRRGHLPLGHRHRLRRHHRPALLRARRGVRAAGRPAQTTNARGVPVVSILVAAVVGDALLRPVPELEPAGRRGHRCDRDHVRLRAGVAGGAAPARRGPGPRPYRMPMPKVLLPTAFVSANLILYWGGYEYTWKIAVALVVGLVIFGIGTQLAGTDVMPMLRPALLDRSLDRRPGHHRRSRAVRRRAATAGSRSGSTCWWSSCSAWRSSTGR